MMQDKIVGNLLLRDVFPDFKERSKSNSILVKAIKSLLKTNNEITVFDFIDKHMEQPKYFNSYFEETIKFKVACESVLERL